MTVWMKFEMPDDKTDFDLAKNGGKYWDALWDFKKRILSYRKYGIPLEQDGRVKLPGEVVDLIENDFYDCCSGIDWEEIP